MFTATEGAWEIVSEDSCKVPRSVLRSVLQRSSLKKPAIFIATSTKKIKLFSFF